MNEIEKFLNMEDEKRERVIKAAMKEFCQGYKKASTDNIVRDAGISKGLLFHYFGTKERLYNFLIDYAVDTLKREFLSLVNIEQADILESVWQMSLLKQELSISFPDIFDFMTSAYVDTSIKSEGVKESLSKFKEVQSKVMADVYTRTDTTLFRDDIDPTLAMQIISWSLQGYAQSKVNISPGESIGAAARDNYELFLKEFQEILNTLRKCFYK